MDKGFPSSGMEEIPTNHWTPKFDTFGPKVNRYIKKLPTNNSTYTMPTNILLAMLTFTDQHQSGIQCCGVVILMI
jgi:hypothetical protein